ncbi:MAG: S41 family peptidase [Acidimicrobiales bacterium]|nr:S41 family peptidase [Hyphomonadaceae bacterium]RZV40308.1 MAG: S41 family peptidase [Acidimicrobiales bacterium]
MALSLKQAGKLTGLTLLGTVLGLSAGTFASSKPSNKSETYDQLVLFADVLSRVQNDYVEEVESPELVENALNGVLQSLDPHSRYVPPAAFEKQQERARREYGGLGIEVSMESGFVKVNYANQGAPASRAGIVAGDLITHVEGVSVEGKTLNQAVEKMRGLAGDPIKITVKSVDRAPREITVVREVVQGRAVRHRILEGLGYIYLETFNNENVARDLAEAIDLLEKENNAPLPGLILDIRNNGGGLLDQSVDVSGHFLSGGEVVSVRGRKDDDIDRYHAKHGQKLAGVPMIVLINGNSASASEIVAGALQDRGRALVVGTPTFGKGSVQSVYPLRGGKEGALRLTTARYFTPAGSSIQGLGIKPDVWVESFPDDGKKRIRISESSLPHALDAIIKKTEGDDQKEKKIKKLYPPEDWPEDKDFQIEQAVKILKSTDFKTRLRQAFND